MKYVNTWRIFLIWLAVGAAVVLFIALLGTAKSHDWYDAACCSERDCRPAELGEIRYGSFEGQTGWWITAVDPPQFMPELKNGFPNGRVRRSQDNDNHICLGVRGTNYGRAPFVRCLYRKPADG